MERRSGPPHGVRRVRPDGPEADLLNGVPALQLFGLAPAVSVAHVWAEQERLLDKTRQRMPVEDSYIAATARRRGLTIATGKLPRLQAPHSRMSISGWR